jgi:hypothetical protein
MAGIPVANQAKALCASVKGLDMKNILINLTGNKANLKELNIVKDFLRKNGFKDAIINIGTDEKYKHDQTTFQFNAVVVTVKQ